jgi:methenyltetrahydrofolate cyclohydrolase
MRVSDYTLEQLRRAVAERHPMPAGVAVAAVSGSLALGLLAKVLAVSRRKALSGDAARLESLAAAAAAASGRMLQLADDDVAAFDAYLAANRLPSATEHEREERRRAVESALARAIEVPLAAAQEAAAGLQLCSDVATLAPRELIADLGVTTALLEGARRGCLLCADSNVQQLESAATPRREP